MINIDDLIQTIHSNDTMMTATCEAYFKTSLSALDCIERACNCAQKDKINNILDIGCGYGRVLRALRARWPVATIVASDLMSEAVQFCEETFGAIAHQSFENLDQAGIDRRFDLIWVGSVFTHLPSDGWHDMLSYLSEHLAPDGLLVFTTHGRTAQWVFQNHSLGKSHITIEQFKTLKEDFSNTGFGFIGYTDGMIKHINDKNGAAVSSGSYGISFSRPDWVCHQINGFPSLILQAITEGGWGKNHDVVAVSKPVDLRIV